MLIVFCKECGRRVSEAELASGKARRVDEMEVVCPDCSPAPKSASSSSMLAKTRTSQTMKAQTRRITTMSLAGVAPRERSGDDDRVVRDAANHKMSIIAISAGVCFLALGVMIFAGGGKSDVAQAKTDAKQDRPSQTSAPEIPARVVAPPAPTPVAARPVEVKPNPAQASTPPAAPLPGMLTGPDMDMTNFRNELAVGRLKEAQDFATANPQDPWTYKDKLESVARSYRSTPAGDQAAKILADLKVPEKPKPPTPPTPKGDGDWKPIFDGKSMDPIHLGGAGGWHIENGALIKEPNTDNAPQSTQEFGDGEYRFRFESNGCSSGHFTVRQSSDGSCSVALNSSHFGAGVKTHELIITCSGDQVLATFDGKSIAVEGNPKGTRTGRMQWNAKDGPFRLLSIDQRKIAAQ